MTKAQKAERAEAVEKLREWVRPGMTIFTILARRSDASRTIRFVAMRDNSPLHPNWQIATALGLRLVRTTEGQDGIRIGGVGFDAGASVVSDLAHLLFGDGNALRHEWL
jgi:hypothetical protein